MSKLTGKSGKSQRQKLKASRVSKRSQINSGAVGGAVEGTASHSFRLVLEPKAEDKLRTVFHLREPDYEIEKRVLASQLPLKSLSLTDCCEFYNEVVDLPLRPPWAKSMSKKQHHKYEAEYFEAYLRKLYDQYPPGRLNHFEHNVHVWQELWRTCERSDILVLSADARHPLFHFPPTLYQYVADVMKKPFVLCLNKIDLISRSRVDAWVRYFGTFFPWVQVLPVTSFPREGTVTAEDDNTTRRKARKIGEGHQHEYTPVGAEEVIEVLRNIALKIINDRPEEERYMDTSPPAPAVVPNKKKKAPAPAKGKGGKGKKGKKRKNSDDMWAEMESAAAAASSAPAADQPAEEKKRVRPVTVGMVGHPNVGKSSLINALMARRACKVSSTPGHTKHIQTLAHPDVEELELCDCPGLVFPAVDMPRPLQVICGLFPITNLREPFSTVQYLAERMDLVELYSLSPPELDSDAVALGVEFQWSAYAVCEALAKARNFTVQGSKGTLDATKAAELILGDVCAGNLPFSAPPPLGPPGSTVTGQASPATAATTADSTATAPVAAAAASPATDSTTTATAAAATDSTTPASPATAAAATDSTTTASPATAAATTDSTTTASPATAPTATTTG